MVERITARQFHESEGVGDWRVLFNGAATWFRTGSFAAGVDLVAEIGRLADAADHHPDVDLRYPGVGVTLLTHEVSGLSDRDAALARRISAAARERGIEADPAQVQRLNIAVDALDRPAVAAFWAAVLGYRRLGEEDVVDRHGRGPGLWFQQMEHPRPDRNRIHLDLSVPRDQAAVRIEAALAAGGRLVSDAHAPHWWTLADPEGNEVDVAPWPDDDEG